MLVEIKAARSEEKPVNAERQSKHRQADLHKDELGRLLASQNKPDSCDQNRVRIDHGCKLSPDSCALLHPESYGGLITHLGVLDPGALSLVADRIIWLFHRLPFRANELCL